ncbi:MAG: hypothetical protein GY870_16805 [archaeon]|nr:hypothetical protein [archaeon]
MIFQDLFTDNFYLIDYTIATSILILVIVLYVTKKINVFTWKLYWLGCLLGLCWELPMVLNTRFGVYPTCIYHTPLPFSEYFLVGEIIIIILHSFWDGGLFLVGVFLVNLLCKKPTFEKFKGKELGIQLIWGQASELTVELLSTFSNAWEYTDIGGWNIELFKFNGHSIRIWAQIIWFIAPIVFYYLAIKIKVKSSDKIE